MTCRYCGQPCAPRWGQPGYVNACEACHADCWDGGEPEPWRASFAADADGLEWEVIPACERRRLERHMRTRGISVGRRLEKGLFWLADEAVSVHRGRGTRCWT